MKYNLAQLLEIAKKTHEEKLANKKKPAIKQKEDVSKYFEFMKKHKVSPGTDPIWKFYLETWFESWHDGAFKPRSLNRILKLRIKKSARTGTKYFVDNNKLHPSRQDRNKTILKWILKNIENGKEEKST
jgi:hypothetical protein